MSSLFKPRIEDVLYGKFQAAKEEDLSKELGTNIYKNKDKNLVFAEAFGKDKVYIENLIKAINTTANTNASYKNCETYILTDNPELIPCPNDIYLIYGRNETSILATLDELQEQIMPKGPPPYPIFDENNEQSVFEKNKENPFYRNRRISKTKFFLNLFFWLHELIR